MTSTGKALLAFAPDELRATLLEELELTRYTPNTLTDRRKLGREVELIRKQGYATQDEENEAGMRALSVPVRTPGGDTVAALGVSAPAFRVTIADLTGHLDLLREAADELALRLPIRAT